MLSVFIRLINHIPVVLKSPERYTADGVRVPPLWVSYKRPVRIPPHNSPNVRSDLIRFLKNGVNKCRHKASGAIYTFGPWVPIRRIISQGKFPPLLLRLQKMPGLSGIFDLSTSVNIRPRIKGISLYEGMEYSSMMDQRFAIFIILSIVISFWCILVPAPLALKPEVLSSDDLGLIIKVANDTFVDGVCSTHPQILSPCDCGEPLNNSIRVMLDVDNLYDENGEYKQEKVISAICKYIFIIGLYVALYESVSQDGFWVDTSDWF